MCCQYLLWSKDHSKRSKVAICYTKDSIEHYGVGIIAENYWNTPWLARELDVAEKKQGNENYANNRDHQQEVSVVANLENKIHIRTITSAH